MLKKPEPGAQFQYERTSSIDQPSWPARGSEVEPTTSSRCSSFQKWERSLDPGRMQRTLRHSRANCASPLSLRRPSALGADLKRGKSRSPSALCHVIAHGDEEVRLILSSRIWIDSIKPSNKWPLGRNVGYAGETRCSHLVTSGRRTSEGERERSQMIGWDSKTEVGLPSPQRK